MKIPNAWQEKTINGLIIITGYSTIIFVLMILTFLLISGLPTIGEVNLEICLAGAGTPSSRITDFSRSSLVRWSLPSEPH